MILPHRSDREGRPGDRTSRRGPAARRDSSRSCRPGLKPCEDRTLLSLNWAFDLGGQHYPPIPLPGGGTHQVSDTDLIRNLEAAGNLLSGVLPKWVGTVDVRVSFVGGGGNGSNRASGEAIGSRYLGPAIRGGITYQVEEPAIVEEARTGIDPYPGTPDVALVFDPSFLTSRVWIDETPGLGGAVPADKVEFQSLVVHELVHGLGFDGLRRRDPLGFGSFATDTRSSFDLLTSKLDALLPGETLNFVGRRAKAHHGGAVPLTSVPPLQAAPSPDIVGQAFYHVGNPSWSSMPGRSLVADPMNGVEFPLGVRFTASDLALAGAMLDDVLHVAERSELIFAIDATGSMRDDIAAVQASASEVTAALFEEQPFSRIGVVLFKDGGDDYVARTLLPLSPDPEEVQSALGSISVGGGGDFPESVYSGLMAALGQFGEGGADEPTGKSIILLGDAPPKDPEPISSYTQADVDEAAARGGVTISSAVASAFGPAAAAMPAASPPPSARPVDIHTIPIGSNAATIASFEAIAAANRGRSFRAADATRVVPALRSAIDAAVAAAVSRPPVLGPIADASVVEGEVVRVLATASDPDPGQVLRYSLGPDAPAGATIDPVTGEFSWPTAEEDGPGTYPITVRVTDDGSPAFGDLVAFVVHVAEANRPPVLGPIGDRSVVEGETLALSAVADDPDRPANRLTYRLDPGAPAGAAIDPHTGRFTWTPAEADGPGAYPITIRVVDEGSPGLGDAVTFLVRVGESNRPPVLEPIADVAVDEGGTLVLTARGSDPDLPAGNLSYRLDAGAPAGAAIDPRTGVLTWAVGDGTRTERITVRVTDDGTPAASAARTFAVAVRNVAPTLAAGADEVIPLGTALQRSIAVVDPGGDVARVAVDYGDGTEEHTLPLGVDGIVLLRHDYAGPGTYAVRVTAVDRDGATGGDTFAVTVAGDPPAPPRPGAFRLAVASARVAEGDGAVAVTVRRVGGADGPASVAYAVAGGTATAGADYAPVAGRLAFADGESSRTFLIPLVDDRRPEGEETIVLDLSDPIGATLGEPVAITLSVADDDRRRRASADYDGDGLTDPAAYRIDPGLGLGALDVRPSGGGAAWSVALGGPGDLPVEGDFDGDGRADAAVFNPAYDLDGDGTPDAGAWTIVFSTSGEWRTIPFGAPGTLDRPAPGDYDGDGRTDLAVFRPVSDLTPGAAEWFILPSGPNPGYATTAGAFRVRFGAGGGMDLPAPGDYDGDGTTDIATFRPVSDLVPGAAHWFVLPSGPNPAWRTTAGGYAVAFGAAGDGDRPAVADYDGDGRDDIAAYRAVSDLVFGSAQWFVLPSETGRGYPLTFGVAGDVSAPGDYDGDGTADLVVVDPSAGRWTLRRPAEGRDEALSPGPAGGVPVLAPLASRLATAVVATVAGGDSDPGSGVWPRAGTAARRAVPIDLGLARLAWQSTAIESGRTLHQPGLGEGGRWAERFDRALGEWDATEIDLLE